MTTFSFKMPISQKQEHHKPLGAFVTLYKYVDNRCALYCVILSSRFSDNVVYLIVVFFSY